jgi:hypothetical protein
MVRPKLTRERILAWADAHKARTGFWPSARSGLVVEAPGENWKTLDSALTQGFRGLPGGDSLSRLLHRERDIPRRRGPPRLGLDESAVQLRHQGLTLRQIGARLGVSHEAVARMLRRAEREG